VLSEILDKKGDAEQAKIMRGAVEAIRISEDADDWWNAGMLSRAVAMYEEALLHFADAYCIQSRLALRYSELGDFTKAEMHYQRAFELMPESFGRVESHCFGCEGAFKSKRAQNIADKVFSQLAVKMPDKAQVFYLLGYLRQQQDLDAEAADYFRQAVKLDPDYLNAWKKLQGMAEAVDMSREEREKIVLELFRLEPGSGSSLQSLTNLRLLWDTLLSTEANQPKQESGSLYVLAASAEAMAKDPNYQRQKEYMMSRFTEGTNFRQVFVQHPLIQSLGQLMQMAAQRGY
jgi:tetratricopeptide (TPR) repeat protein